MKKSSKNITASNMNKDLFILKESFKGAHQFLKMAKPKQIPHSQSLATLPKYLLLGSIKSGKTSLLVNSQLKFILAKKMAQEKMGKINSTYLCDWWVTNESIILDTNGKFIHTDNEEVKYSVLWREFIKLLKKYQHERPLHGVIITISTEELLTQTKEQQQILRQHIEQKLFDLSQLLKVPLAVYFIVTKCDQIPGFTEFFDHLSPDEKEHLWGFQFTNDTSIQEQFDNQLERFLQRINDHLLTRLHQERSQNKREKIHEFPLQTAKVNQALHEFCNELLAHLSYQPQLHLKGIYFTSSIQTEQSVNLIESDLSKTFPLQVYEGKQKENTTQSYFIKNFFEQLEVIHGSIAKGLGIKARHLIYLFSSLIVLSAIVFLFQDYRYSIIDINQAETAITQYQLLAKQIDFSKHDPKQLLAALNHLRNANEKIHQRNQSLLGILGISANQGLEKDIKQAYMNCLKHQMLPWLKSLLESRITQPQSAISLYGDLKSSLMLSEPRLLNKDFMIDWLKRYWQETHHTNTKTLIELQNHLTTLLENAFKPITIDKSMIQEARKKLTTINKDELAYIILQNMPGNVYINPFEKIMRNKSLENFIDIESGFFIPRIYTRKGYESIFLSYKTEAIKEAMTGNWIIGSLKNTQSISEKDLSTQIDLLYMSDYKKTWNTLITRLTPIHQTNIIHLIKTLKILAANHSPLIEILQVIKENTDLPNDGENEVATILLGDRFKLINKLIEKYQSSRQSSLLSAIDKLKSLQSTLLSITNRTSEKSASFNFAKSHLADKNHSDIIEQLYTTAKFSPEPLKTWLNVLANNSWQLILSDAQSYIGQVWKLTVYPEYQQKIENKYPISKKAKTEIKLTDFVSFFGPNGTLENFYNWYLKPFVDTTNLRWRFVHVNNMSFDIPDNNLTHIQRGFIIQKMFFPKHQKKLTIHFKLKSLAMEAIVKEFLFSMNDKNIEFTPFEEKSDSFVWPDVDDTTPIKLKFIDVNGKKHQITYKSDWSLFRLLDKSNVLTTKNPNQYNITFDLDGSAAKFKLLANYPINPFIPNILEEFNLPENLLVATNLENTKTSKT